MAKSNQNYDKVKDLYHNNTQKDIANKLGLSRGTVGTVARRLHLNKPNPRLWTNKETKALLKYYEYGTAFVMEKLPNRTKWAIINKYRELKKLR